MNSLCSSPVNLSFELNDEGLSKTLPQLPMSNSPWTPRLEDNWCQWLLGPTEEQTFKSESVTAHYFYLHFPACSVSSLKQPWLRKDILWMTGLLRASDPPKPVCRGLWSIADYKGKLEYLYIFAHQKMISFFFRFIWQFHAFSYRISIDITYPTFLLSHHHSFLSQHISLLLSCLRLVWDQLRIIRASSLSVDRLFTRAQATSQ